MPVQLRPFLKRLHVDSTRDQFEAWFDEAWLLVERNDLTYTLTQEGIPCKTSREDRTVSHWFKSSVAYKLTNRLTPSWGVIDFPPTILGYLTRYFLNRSYEDVLKERLAFKDTLPMSFHNGPALRHPRPVRPLRTQIAHLDNLARDLPRTDLDQPREHQRALPEAGQRPPKRPKETQPAVEVVEVPDPGRDWRRAVEDRPAKRRRGTQQRVAKVEPAYDPGREWRLAAEDRRRKPKPVKIKSEPEDDIDLIGPHHQPNPDFRPIRQENCKVEPGTTRSPPLPLTTSQSSGSDQEPTETPGEAFHPTFHQPRHVAPAAPAMMAGPGDGEDPPSMAELDASVGYLFQEPYVPEGGLGWNDSEEFGWNDTGDNFGFADADRVGEMEQRGSAGCECDWLSGLRS